MFAAKMFMVKVFTAKMLMVKVPDKSFHMLKNKRQMLALSYTSLAQLRKQNTAVVLLKSTECIYLK